MFIMEKLLYNLLVSRKLCHLLELSMIVLGWSRFVLLIQFCTVYDEIFEGEHFRGFHDFFTIP